MSTMWPKEQMLRSTQSCERLTDPISGGKVEFSGRRPEMRFPLPHYQLHEPAEKEGLLIVRKNHRDGM